MRSLQDLDHRHGILGTSVPRLDSAQKVQGRTRYGADIQVPGMLHARLVLSPYAHARIVSIDSAAALVAPGVEAVLTARDLPIRVSGDARLYEPLARDEVTFAGQPVAMVLARSEAEAEDAAELLAVDWEPLEVVVDVEAALSPGSPTARISRPEVRGMHGGGHALVNAPPEGETEPVATDNGCGLTQFDRGDVDSVMAACEAVVRSRFTTSWVYQGYLEPQVAIARLDDDDTLEVISSTQGIFYTRAGLARLFSLPPSSIRVVAAPLGGAFGAKTLVIEPLVAAACLATRRPVRLVLTRMEDMAMTNPAPATVIELRIGGDRTGLVALEASIIMDSGAFSDWSMHALAAVVIGGPYRWQAARVTSQCVRTNRFGTGPYRAPSGPQTAFALESLVDELAEHLGVDPIELRAQSLVVPGEPRLDDLPWPPHGARECLDRLRGHSMWRDRASLPHGEGVGVSLCVWPGMNEPAAASCRLEPDGGLSIITGAIDMSGTSTGLAMIAAETFGVRLDRVRIAMSDSGTSPQTPLTGGSTITYSVGLAVNAAARDARAQTIAVASDILEASPGDLDIVDGLIRVKGSPSVGLTLEDLGAKLDVFGSPYPPILGQGRTVPEALAPSATAHLSHVRVDPETGQVTPIAHVIAQDVGRAIDPALIEGQMRGGVAQGIGWALLEGLRHDQNGQLTTGSLLDYALPRASHLPTIETIIVEVPSEHGPFGARGIGESSVVAAAAAVTNALKAASGIRACDLPVTAQAVGRGLASSRPE